MKDIETKISPLISGMFPSFYQSDGPNFIAFVQAYYEWLEQNFQLLDLEDVTGFSVGDTIQQSDVTGTVFSVSGKSILVLVDGLETFKCFNVCSELIPVTSSSGSSTYILKGGTTRRLGSLFLSRNLSKIRDIDKTIDLFIVRFKEKYLKNIEFDTQSNKRLLVKNSLDLFRSKGTSRSIDLFFRLIYGVRSSIYYPGDDLFRLSDSTWIRPQYIEINSTSVDRAIALVGKQITGVNSGATAFVERYVKKKVNAGFVHVFYVTNVKGSFLVNERLKYNAIYPDSPRIVGSLTGAAVLEGSEEFDIGDIVNFDSTIGTGGIGRVTATAKGSGEVSFKVDESGWGYTTNRVGASYYYSTNTFLSDKVLLLANVETGQFLSNVVITSGGLGYSNNDKIYISSRYHTGEARPVTNTTGGMVAAIITDRGSGYYPAIETPTISVVNSTGYASAGAGAVINPENLSYTYPKKYFEYLETITQPIFFVEYTNPVDITQFTTGVDVQISNIGKYGRVIDIDTANSTITLTLLNKDTLSPGEVIYLNSNSDNKVDVGSVTEQLAQARVINIGNTAVIELNAPSGQITIGDTIYQRNSANDIVASATITKTSRLTLSGGFVDIANLSGVFVPNTSIYVEGKASTAVFRNISFSIAIANSSNTFIDTSIPFIYSSNNGTKGYTLSSTAGTNARYKVAALSETQEVRINTDGLTNNELMDTKLNANTFGLAYKPGANISSIIFGSLNYATVTVGSISTLGDVNPGTGYNQAPIASVYQPFIPALQARDYTFTIANNETTFLAGEYIEQTNYSNFVKIFVSNTQPYRMNEKVHAGNTTTSFIANGVVYYVNEANKYIELEFPVGNFPTTNNFNLKSLISTANSYITNAVPFVGSYTARGIVKDVIDDKVYVKRIQLDNKFVTGNNVSGTSTGTLATLVSVDLDMDSDPAGFNAKVSTKASTANGVISNIQIIDSGYGFSNDDEIVFTANDEIRTGRITNIKGGVGTGTGYYSSAKGFLSDISKVHDGDYYQEYSYDILSRIPLGKYGDMFKKVMHTAGTRFFGSILVDTIANTTVEIVDSLVDISDMSPYVIQDRQYNDVQDRDDFFIEIRE